MANNIFTRSALTLLLALSLSAEIIAKDLGPTTFAPESDANVTITIKDKKIFAQINKEKVFEVGELDPGAGMTDEKPIIVADFNFDGANDFAVLDGIGYGGVNVFYRIYLWEKGKLHFREIKETVSNPVLKKDQAMIVSAQRSGPRWYQTIYRVVDGEMYRFVDAQMLGDAKLWGITFPDAEGKPGKRAVVSASWFDAPATPIKPPERHYSAQSCNGQKVSAKPGSNKTKERVLLLDFREEGAEVQIQRIKKKQTTWVNADCLMESP